MGHHPEPKTYISEKLPEGLRKSMETFQAKNSLPVFLKGGPMDRVLYLTTLALCGLGILGTFKLVYDLGFSGKKKE
ncbi:cytochrome c oxidase subunit 7A, mitochondrial-like [Sabethes cyaneus]|uniref:cytochrome c oxidase subunit 7A, mitochondrial-like n=1 Tax=Sabethes cyaneus TaxID=53552 RepID=UPI00237EC35E|nr:cytochrome c oxidase subunit 7A, mitochondrial-like [Sabethes cyaneus]